VIYFVSGGVRSGKSTFAEKLVKKLTISRRVYLATAKVYDNEMSERVKKHREDRKMDNWYSIEKPTDITDINLLNKDDVVLIDCLTNLVANEMFDNSLDVEQVIEKVFNQIVKLNENINDLVIVSNDLFSAKDDYSLETENYIKALGRLHCKICSVADQAYELSYGIAIKRKGE